MASGLPFLKTVFLGGRSSVSKPFLFFACPTTVSRRNTYILKRRVPVPRFKKHVDPELVKRNLEPLYQEYEVVKDENRDKFPHIDLVLTQYVEDIGKPGQLVSIQPLLGYDLVILGQAMYATPENIAKMKLLSESETDKYSSLTAYKTGNMLKKRTLSVFMNMDEPWTMERWHIRATYRLAGVQILTDDCIELPDKPINGPNMDWEGKDFVVHIIINNRERIPVRCRLRHYTKIYHQRIALPLDHECTPSDPIFPEQAELLDSIPLPEYIVNLKMA